MAKPPGVWAASLTPFRSDESVDVALLVEHLSDLQASGCDGALVFGTTGEGLSLTAKERIDALEQIVDRGVDPDRLLVGTGATAFPDLLDLTREATALGVRGVLVQPPFHLKRLSDDGIYRTYDRLVQDVGDADLRLYVYHFPQATGIPVPMSVLDRLRRVYPDQLAGVKDSSGDGSHTAALCERFPELDIFAGTERLLLSVLENGGAGCISASANVTAPLARRVVERWQQDADARPLQDALTDIRTHIASTPMIPTLKRLVAERTDRPAWLRTRPPLPVLPTESDDSLSSLQTALDRALEHAQPA